MKEAIKQFLESFRAKKILVIGDIMLDEFIWGKVSRISPEAPVPVVEVQREEFFTGGAANVARNLRPFGVSVLMMGRVGKDREGKQLLQLLKKEGVKTDYILNTSTLPTIVKTRIIAKTQQMVRVDKEVCDGLSQEHFARIKTLLKKALPEVDAVIIEDYGKGFVTQSLVDEVAKQCKKYKKIWTVDPNPNNPLNWFGATAIKPNRNEAFLFSGVLFSEDKKQLQRVGETLLKRWKAQLLLITLGEHGMQLFQKGKSSYASATKAREVFDVSGAGDTAIAIFTLALSAGATPQEATEMANHAAGVVVGKLGTATLTASELLESFQRG
ncbi:MAG: D-glycero-beta-D-manno-heptose-7-phosphate kinase [Verrucomicrobiae bacterium]|nr:D-glycero-beta-D-manno-heptose-7-phosphate kinase [Verrucomicrobiae bacterium]